MRSVWSPAVLLRLSERVNVTQITDASRFLDRAHVLHSSGLFISQLQTKKPFSSRNKKKRGKMSELWHVKTEQLERKSEICICIWNIFIGGNRLPVFICIGIYLTFYIYIYIYIYNIIIIIIYLSICHIYIYIYIYILHTKVCKKLLLISNHLN